MELKGKFTIHYIDGNRESFSGHAKSMDDKWLIVEESNKKNGFKIVYINLEKVFKIYEY